MKHFFEAFHYSFSRDFYKNVELFKWMSESLASFFKKEKSKQLLAWAQWSNNKNYKNNNNNLPAYFSSSATTLKYHLMSGVCKCIFTF